MCVVHVNKGSGWVVDSSDTFIDSRRLQEGEATPPGKSKEPGCDEI